MARRWVGGLFCPCDPFIAAKTLCKKALYLCVVLLDSKGDKPEPPTIPEQRGRPRSRSLNRKATQLARRLQRLRLQRRRLRRNRSLETIPEEDDIPSASLQAPAPIIPSEDDSPDTSSSDQVSQSPESVSISASPSHSFSSQSESAIESPRSDSESESESVAHSHSDADEPSAASSPAAHLQIFETEHLAIVIATGRRAEEAVAEPTQRRPETVPDQRPEQARDIGQGQSTEQVVATGQDQQQTERGTVTLVVQSARVTHSDESVEGRGSDPLLEVTTPQKTEAVTFTKERGIHANRLSPSSPGQEGPEDFEDFDFD
ncbi:hypothetical protein PV10_02862 [Exophiala mesophila]|uniref:Uncharacterized protein n=1 Tax=Exophiala mesophila TaxID=212818 RepID=A0A0D1Y3H6_EXOME|nr:uncharacterized protein PV10_02862 [Exophiala mesophila]KIV95181.1 hypothetical protein PV10_02862 [Exophiala mesophila]